MNYRPTRLVIEKEISASPLVQRILAALWDIPVHWVNRLKEDAIGGDGSVLEIARYKGQFIKPCPGTRSYHCCGYQILHLGSQCPIGCTYCILQAYFPNSNLRLFANLSEMMQQLEAHLSSSPRQVHRVGTGEFTDSLLLDPLTRSSELLVPFFADQPSAVLELKTKTAQVDLLEDLDHRGHTIVAWSLNPEEVIAREEAGAASLAERIDAARRCQQWGYRVAFHFDPLLAYPNWKQGYRQLVDQLFTAVNSGTVAWVSLGALRFMPALKPIIRKRYPTSDILAEEFIQGLDGKLRYFRDLRVEMFRHLGSLLRAVNQNLCIYLCMESEDIWREALGFAPKEQGGLSGMLDRQALP